MPSRSMSWLGSWKEKWSPPIYDDDDDGGLNVSSFGSDSNSDGGRLPLLNYFVPLLMYSSSVLVELVMDKLVDPLYVPPVCMLNL
jgi:hypothetical protein